jgi:hypothetical protein
MRFNRMGLMRQREDRGVGDEWGDNCHMNRHLILNVLSAICAIAAGVAWVRSTIVWVKAPPDRGLGGVIGGNIYDEDKHGRRYDVLKTIKKQSSWNRIAAWFAAASALFQAAVIIF